MKSMLKELRGLLRLGLVFSCLSPIASLLLTIRDFVFFRSELTSERISFYIFLLIIPVILFSILAIVHNTIIKSSISNKTSLNSSERIREVA